jgi:uncharacterized protein YycO
MKKSIIISTSFLALVVAGIYLYKKKIYYPKHKLEIAQNEVKEILEKNELESGDIIFQTSLSPQSQAIQLATNSKYSHYGLIFNENGMYVFEAIQPVKMTPLAEWIARGKDGKYVIKRLKKRNKYITSENYNKVPKWGKEFMDKDYDFSFEWSDNKFYCSELVWKMYDRCFNIQIGKLQKLKDFDLSNPKVKQKLKERYGKNIPMEELVISPQAIFESDLLETVKEN